MDKKSFDTMKNGYNRYQVDDYLNTLETENKQLSVKLQLVEKSEEALREALSKKQEAYEQLSSQLDIKEKAANDLARIAMKEANMIVDTAKHNADAILKESLMMARGILLDIARLGNEANEIKGSMKDELRQLENALDAFETPQIPDMDLLKKRM